MQLEFERCCSIYCHHLRGARCTSAIEQRHIQTHSHCNSGWNLETAKPMLMHWRLISLWTCRAGCGSAFPTTKVCVLYFGIRASESHLILLLHFAAYRDLHLANLAQWGLVKKKMSSPEFVKTSFLDNTYSSQQGCKQETPPCFFFFFFLS